MELEQSEIYLWQKNLLQKEINCIEQSKQYLFTPKNNQQIRKLNGYQFLCGEMKNFSTLIALIGELQEDFDETLCLLLGGHYKASLLLLRSHFELANNIVRAIESNQPTINFFQNRYKKGTRKFKTKSFKDKMGKDWIDEIISLYDELSKFAHPSAKSTSHSAFNSLPQPIFTERSFNYCFAKINNVVDHNAGIFKVCLKSDLWRQDLLANIFGKSFKLSADEYEYKRDIIEYLYQNIDNKIVKKYLEQLNSC